MPNSDYNFVSRLLHKIALTSKVIPEISFDIENTLIKKKRNTFSDNHVFVSGLARSGTTILMRYLYDTGFFKSLTYLDMPFVLMPNTWKQISHKKPLTEHKERAHRDGIMLGFDSPEAFEEVFWRVFCGEKYICEDRLRLHPINADILEKFKDYINIILSSSDSVDQTRYLSKNNNNVLRLSYLQKSMPNAYFIIPFRDPLQHSFSLLTQHLHFSKLQAEDKFSLNYMNWLGHFEFGLNQKSFFLNDNEIFNEMGKYPKTDINFWLLNWKNYYKYVIDKQSTNTIFFDYERLCEDPSSVMSDLFVKLNVDNKVIKLEPFKRTAKTVTKFDGQLLEECNSIYKQLKDKFDLWYDKDDSALSLSDHLI
ncbi:MAG: Sulfotransferase family protein [Mucilaginibacter sp.]|nr:Sulfotransferase family protein [Mucilaginibacter sp.]